MLFNFRKLFLLEKKRQKEHKDAQMKHFYGLHASKKKKENSICIVL
jgi:hypothetical protein